MLFREQYLPSVSPVFPASEALKLLCSLRQLCQSWTKNTFRKCLFINLGLMCQVRLTCPDPSFWRPRLNDVSESPFLPWRPVWLSSRDEWVLCCILVERSQILVCRVSLDVSFPRIALLHAHLSWLIYWWFLISLSQVSQWTKHTVLLLSLKKKKIEVCSPPSRETTPVSSRQHAPVQLCVGDNEKKCHFGLADCTALFHFFWLHAESFSSFKALCT